MLKGRAGAFSEGGACGVFCRTRKLLIASSASGRRRDEPAVFLLLVVLLFIGSVLLVLTRQVRVKQLPYDNKDEILLVLDMPAGTTLERTDAAARDFEHYLKSVPEVTDFESYVGTTSPVYFNGMMRQYFLRRAPNRADIRVNLIHKTEREYSSHALTLRIRSDLMEIAKRNAAKLKIVELPAGPPTMSTMVAAVYGGPTQTYEDIIAAASAVKERMPRERASWTSMIRLKRTRQNSFSM
jgi:multidrug efflux pump subunit AcrB